MVCHRSAGAWRDRGVSSLGRAPLSGSRDGRTWFVSRRHRTRGRCRGRTPAVRSIPVGFTTGCRSEGEHAGCDSTSRRGSCAPRRSAIRVEIFPVSHVLIGSHHGIVSCAAWRPASTNASEARLRPSSMRASLGTVSLARAPRGRRRLARGNLTQLQAFEPVKASSAASRTSGRLSGLRSRACARRRRRGLPAARHDIAARTECPLRQARRACGPA